MLLKVLIPLSTGLLWLKSYYIALDSIFSKTAGQFGYFRFFRDHFFILYQLYMIDMILMFSETLNYQWLCLNLVSHNIFFFFFLKRSAKVLLLFIQLKIFTCFTLTYLVSNIFISNFIVVFLIASHIKKMVIPEHFLFNWCMNIY